MKPPRTPLAWNGIPVPYVTLWSGESEPAFAPLADGRVLFSTRRDPGAGRPLFAKSHSGRLWRALTGRLCNVCGEALAPGWVFAVPLTPPGEPEGPGLKMELSEPPAHAACLRLACELCPALVARRPPVWALMDWRTIGRQSLAADVMPSIRKSLAMTLPARANAPIITEVVYVPEGPIRCFDYADFIAGRVRL